MQYFQIWHSNRLHLRISLSAEETLSQGIEAHRRWLFWSLHGYSWIRINVDINASKYRFSHFRETGKPQSLNLRLCPRKGKLFSRYLQMRINEAHVHLYSAVKLKPDIRTWGTNFFTENVVSRFDPPTSQTSYASRKPPTALENSLRNAKGTSTQKLNRQSSWQWQSTAGGRTALPMGKYVQVYLAHRC